MLGKKTHIHHELATCQALLDRSFSTPVCSVLLLLLLLLLLFRLHSLENRGSERLSDTPKDTQRSSSRTRGRTETPTPKPVLLLPTPHCPQRKLTPLFWKRLLSFQTTNASPPSWSQPLLPGRTHLPQEVKSKPPRSTVLGPTTRGPGHLALAVRPLQLCGHDAGLGVLLAGWGGVNDCSDM